MREDDRPLAVVTGVTGEIGVAVARRLWQSGVGVLGVHGHAGRAAERLVREARTGHHELTLARVDLAAPGARRRVFELVRRHGTGRVTAFLGLAGVSARGVWRESWQRLERSRFEHIYRVDTLSHMWFAQALGPALRRRRGRIVLMSSSAGLIGDELGVPFALAKAANLALVKSLARLLAPEVAVNGVAPGAIETAWLAELTPAERRAAKRKALLGRFGRPEEVAAAFYQLAFGEIGFVTGQVLVMDGGAF